MRVRKAVIANKLKYFFLKVDISTNGCEHNSNIVTNLGSIEITIPDGVS